MAGPGHILLVDDDASGGDFSSSACIGVEGLAGVISALSKMQGIEAVLSEIAQVDRAMPLSHAPARGIRV